MAPAASAEASKRGVDAHGPVVHDFGGTLHADDGDRVALTGTIGNGGKDLVGGGGDALQVGRPAAAGMPSRSRTKTRFGPLSVGSELDNACWNVVGKAASDMSAPVPIEVWSSMTLE